jgi:flagellar biosynthetic protein FlhB
VAEDRTEAPTAKRRQKAREQGQVARSQELVGSALLLALLCCLPGLLVSMRAQASDYWVQTITAAGQRTIGSADLTSLAEGCLVQVGRMAGPVLGLVATGALVSNVLQVGLIFTPGLLQPKLSRLNTLAGFQRLMSARAGVELAKGAARVALVGFSGWQYFAAHREALLGLAATDPGFTMAKVGELAYGLSLRMVATLAVLAALDYAYQKWQLERSLRMTKQEIKDEMRESEGNPETRARIRQRQRESARRRMMAAVPKASVVITNPIHFAVALQYEIGQRGAPTVVAKGMDLIALRIREVAAEHHVPLVENPPLARSLYRGVEIGEEIPPELYRAVAEVLALIWRAADQVRIE